MHEIPRDKPVATMCVVGQRAYNAMRFLQGQKFDVGVLSGGMLTYQVENLKLKREREREREREKKRKSGRHKGENKRGRGPRGENGTL